MIGGLTVPADSLRAVLLDLFLRLLGDAVRAVPLSPRHLTNRWPYAVSMVGPRTEVAGHQSRAACRLFLTANDAVAFSSSLVHTFMAIPKTIMSSYDDKLGSVRLVYVTNRLQVYCPFSV